MQKKKRSNRVRIIAGKWRSRFVSFGDSPDLRPTPDRIRETLFNWLSPHLFELRCLDLFAGSGVLGFEALSRGAGSVLMIEENRHAIENLEENKKQLGATEATVKQANGFLWLQRGNQSEEKFHVVFLDPPYQSNSLHDCLTLLVQREFLGKDALIYVEHNQPLNLGDWRNIEMFKTKRTGYIHYGLLCYKG